MAGENFERPTSNIQPRMQLCPTWAFGVGRFICEAKYYLCFSTTMGAAWGDMRCARVSPKMLQFLTCHALGRGCILCVQPDSHAITCCLLLTGIHRLLAPLFTSIRILFVTLTPPHRHDSTKTRNSARVT